MIPDIGLIVAAYVVTRMIRIIVKRDPKEHGAVVLFSVITILVTLVSAADLLFRGGFNVGSGSLGSLRSEPAADPIASAYETNTRSPLLGLTKDEAKRPQQRRVVTAKTIIGRSMADIERRFGVPQGNLGFRWTYRTGAGVLDVYFDDAGLVKAVEPETYDISLLEQKQ